MTKLKLPQSKRLKFAVYAFVVYVLQGIGGMLLNYDLSSLAVYTASTSIPLLAYILGDTLRPSKPIENEQN